ncbi:MAG: MFS transporter, partial [Chloroflexi bacterium]|nr:MFS transporter [Chloroflexota bacterium]
PEQEPKPRTRISPRSYVANVLAHRELSKYVGSQFFFWLGTGAAVPFLTRFAVEVLGATESESFQLVLVAVITTALLSGPAGMAGDRWGRQRVLSIGLLLYAALGVVGSQAQNVVQGIAVMAAFGLINSIAQAMVFPLLTDLMPRGRLGEFTGLGTMIWSLAQPLGSTAAGFAIDLTGSYRAVFIVSSVMIFVSFLLLRTVRPELAHTDDDDAALALTPAQTG